MLRWVTCVGEYRRSLRRVEGTSLGKKGPVKSASLDNREPYD